MCYNICKLALKQIIKKRRYSPSWLLRLLIRRVLVLIFVICTKSRSIVIILHVVQSLLERLKQANSLIYGLCEARNLIDRGVKCTAQILHNFGLVIHGQRVLHLDTP